MKLTVGSPSSCAASTPHKSWYLPIYFETTQCFDLGPRSSAHSQTVSNKFWFLRILGYEADLTRHASCVRIVWQDHRWEQHCAAEGGAAWQQEGRRGKGREQHAARFGWGEGRKSQCQQIALAEGRIVTSACRCWCLTSLSESTRIAPNCSSQTSKTDPLAASNFISPLTRSPCCKWGRWIYIYIYLIYLVFYSYMSVRVYIINKSTNEFDTNIQTYNPTTIQTYKHTYLHAYLHTYIHHTYIRT